MSATATPEGGQTLSFNDAIGRVTQPQQVEFVYHFVKCRNRAEAARRAGYSSKSAANQGSRLWKNEYIQEAIRAYDRDKLGRLSAGKDDFIGKMSDIALANPFEFREYEGGLKVSDQVNANKFLISRYDQLDKEQRQFGHQNGLPPLIINCSMDPGWDPKKVRPVYPTDSAIVINFTRKQSEFFLRKNEYDEGMYGGAGSSGKSFGGRWGQVWNCWYLPGYTGLIYRRKRIELLGNHLYSEGGLLRVLRPWIDSGVIHWDAQYMVMTFPNQARLYFMHFDHPSDIERVQGFEFQGSYGDEASQLPPQYHREVRGRSRAINFEVSPFVESVLPGIQYPINEYGTNPGYVGHGWFKRGFVDPGGATGEVFLSDPEEGELRRLTILANIDDNPFVDENYEKRARAIGGDRGKAMLGDWDILEGSFFGAYFDRNEHVVPWFPIPPSWFRFRCYDHGFTSDPYYIGWLAESDGCAVEIEVDDLDENGHRIKKKVAKQWPAGTLVLFHESYGVGPDGETHNGLFSAAIADETLEIDAELARKHPQFRIDADGVADGQIYESRDGRSPGKEFRKKGISYAKADKSPGSVAARLEQACYRFQAHHPPADLPEDVALSEWRQTRPGLVFMANCPTAIRDFTEAIRHDQKPNRIADQCRDHSIDAITYGLMWRPGRITVDQMI